MYYALARNRSCLGNKQIRGAQLLLQLSIAVCKISGYIPTFQPVISSLHPRSVRFSCHTDFPQWIRRRIPDIDIHDHALHE